MSNQELKRCDFKDCEKLSKSKRGGLCRGHLTQSKRGQELRPLRTRKSKYGSTCTFPDCGLPHAAKGYCSGHSRQLGRGQELAPLQARAEVNSWIDGFKVCPGCSELKGRDGYYKDAAQPSGYSAYCRECDRWKRIAYRYNLSREQFEAIWNHQGQQCASCGTTESGNDKAFHIDHDHSCCDSKRSCGDCVMGIVCQHCNMNGDQLQTPEFVAYREASRALGQPLRAHVTSLYQLSA